jgi:D-3-phosphoglycerate dehydrogenase
LLKGFFGRISDDPVSYVNAPKMAEERGITVTESTTTTAHNFVNLITIRGGAHSLAGTLMGLDGEARLVMVDDHRVDVPPANHMLVVRNDDRPGMIGFVGTIVGEAGLNIADMDVGQAPNGASAMMVLSITEAVPAEVCERLRAVEGIVSVDAI